MISLFYRRLLIFGAACGMAGVILGAFGAHFLKDRISADHNEVLRTGILYLFIHTLAILMIVQLSKEDLTSRLLRSAGILFSLGILLFSGSLFILSTREVTGFFHPLIGPVTPIGGICFVSGWLMLLIYAVRTR